MDSFIVSARKYRPATFDMVVGQDSITGTLKNAIKNKYLAQAYLFCGPRGVGKTTCARIFAKTINCTNLGDNVEPCNECESCVSFNSLRSLNIHELDAASNNKVEDIRTLTDMVRVPPQIGKYSIYIIDEVHMLSASAFNAFLKTLEEPPPHAVFILATTEKHKIIPTILSRCQIFDFNRIKNGDIVERLKYVAENEKAEYEEEALHIIAVKADGAMRDALSILDQIISFSSGKITYKDVIENLNLLDYEYYFRIIDSVLEGDYSNSFLVFNEILENGFDGHNFIAGLGSHIRDLLISQDEVTLKLLETAPAMRQRYRIQSERCTPDFLLKALEICNSCDLAYKTGKNQRLLVELALFRLASLSDRLSGDDGDEKKKSEPVNLKSPPSKDEVDVAIAYDSGNSDSNRIVPSEAQIKLSEGNAPAPSAQREYGRSQKESAVKAILMPATKTLSVRDIMANGVKEPGVDNKLHKPTGEIPNTETIQKVEFTMTNLVRLWQEFAASIRSESPRIAGQLIENIPSGDISDKPFVIKLSNSALKEEFDRRYKGALADYLQKRVDKHIIYVDSQLESAESKETVYYTDEQKFSHLSAKNPALRQLRQELNLDFE